jgi:hypothetical protein
VLRYVIITNICVYYVVVLPGKVGERGPLR